VKPRLVADTNAIVDLLRVDRRDPPPLRDSIVLLPLPVVGELFMGAHYSHRVDENLTRVEELAAELTILHPDLATARVYGRLRGTTGAGAISPSRTNDLWIAALCIQHGLPLLTNDRGFETIAELSVIHW
jgi:tRNA(fMet)-specific endonuclease VapC